MEALWSARVEHLLNHDTVSLECLECGHKSEVSVEAIRAKLPDWYRVKEIWRVMKCANCGQRGRGLVDARRALGHDAAG